MHWTPANAGLKLWQDSARSAHTFYATKQSQQLFGVITFHVCNIRTLYAQSFCLDKHLLYNFIRSSVDAALARLHSLSKATGCIVDALLVVGACHSLTSLCYVVSGTASGILKVAGLGMWAMVTILPHCEGLSHVGGLAICTVTSVGWFFTSGV